MAPTKPLDPSILFHPKKKKPGQAPPPPPPRARPSPHPTPEAQRRSPSKAPDEPVDAINPPASSGGKFKEYKIVSSKLNGWKYDVMKFDTRKTIDIPDFFQNKGPHKLNRKDPPRSDVAPVTAPQPVGPMLGPDNKPVIGADGRMVMVDAEGRPIHNTNGAAANGVGDKGKPGRKKFQKKTRQVYLIPEETRQLRKEERYPWVMEVPSQNELWVAKLEEVSKAETHAFFMPASADTFKFVPAHRWYKFQKKPNYKIPNLEEAESMMAKMQKNKDPSRWLAQNFASSSNGASGSGATTSVSMPYIQSGPSLVYDAGTSLGPGGRRLRTVDSGMERGLFGDDDDDGDNRKRRAREYGGEGDQDEMDYEEIFQDDEEKPDVNEAEDEEAKEVEERIKKEYSKAKVMNDGEEEDEDEDDESKLTRAGRQLRKLMRSIEKNQAYESDDDDNPYLSEEEDSEEETPEVPAGPAVQDQSRSGSQQPPATPVASPTPIKTESSLPNLSRPTSPTQSGHSVVAKRATSPKVPKIKTSPNVSRASSPLAQGPASPNGRASSPSMPGSPAVPNRPNKRKAEDASPTSPTSPKAAANGDQPKPKKPKVYLPIADLTAAMIARWLRTHPGAKTVDCIAQFRQYIKDTEARKYFTALVREVGSMEQGSLYIKEMYKQRDPEPGVGPKPPVQAS